MVAPLMVHRYASTQGKDKMPMLDPLQKKVELAENDVQKQRAEGNLRATTLLYQSLDQVALTLPNHPLDPAKLPLKVDLGGIEAVIETYPGHTPGDVIVRVPAQNIVFTGDLLFNGSYPATFDADMLAYRETAAKFAAFDKDTIFVPGHGQVCGQEGVALERAIFDDLAEHAKKMVAAGVSVEEAQSRKIIRREIPVHAKGGIALMKPTAVLRPNEPLPNHPDELSPLSKAAFRKWRQRWAARGDVSGKPKHLPVDEAVRRNALLKMGTK
jgi:glyoxylase-like metal-dependent hydrolase (beta-lactamase superfamily II)